MIKIGWLYPSLMSTYGDRGNVLCLKKRAIWRDINVKISVIEIESPLKNLEGVDLLVGGGAQDRQQEIVMRDLIKQKGEIIRKLIEKGIPGLFTCGFPQLLGRYYEPAYGKKIDGLGIFDMYSVHPGPGKPRCIGNIVVKLNKNYNGYNHYNDYNNYLVGFENHGGRTYLGKNVKPFATVIRGFGNNGQDKTEGAVYKNAIATYLHGPILPKNQFFADFLLELVLERKYKKKIELKRLDDELEKKAHDVMVKRTLR